MATFLAEMPWANETRLRQRELHVILKDRARSMPNARVAELVVEVREGQQ